ncbi:GNAT family N-acetyltransferase [Candidatus Thorarchaeota archaeon]|nr:MAG: GNAT family N-acetyltransferase [Candidatus Thorarchaeota archaeon]
MLEIRAAVDTDFNLLRNMYLEEVENHVERAIKFAEDLIHRFKTILALQDNKLVGSLCWDTRGGYDDGVIELVTIGVNNAYKKQGIATKMVKSLIDEASEYYASRGYNLRVIILFMEKQNDVAGKFYTNLGFSEEAIIKKLYPHDDGVIWTRHL